MAFISVTVGALMYTNEPARGKIAGSAPTESLKLLDYHVGQDGAAPVDTQRPRDDSPAAAEPARIANAHMSPIDTTDQQFEYDVIKSPVSSVVVEFWRPGCKYCEQLEPELVKLAAGLPERFKIVKVNTRECPETRNRYPISGVPTLFLIENGKVTKVLSARTARELRDELGLN